MTTSNEKFLILNGLPAYTVEQWLSTYKDFITTYYTYSKEERKTQRIIDFVEQINKVKVFLKSKKVKFI
jgi:hypothetical protein